MYIIALNVFPYVGRRHDVDTKSRDCRVQNDDQVERNSQCRTFAPELKVSKYLRKAKTHPNHPYGKESCSQE